MTKLNFQELTNTAIHALTNPDNFIHYTLTYSEFKKWIAFFVQVFMAITILGYLFLGRRPGKFGWVISLINSGVMSMAGMYYIYMTIQQPRYEGFYSLTITDPQLIHSYNNASVIITLWFIIANIVDLVNGYLFYPECMELLTGYIHHIVYILLLVVGISGNTYFFGKVTPYSSGFTLALIEELPTFCLAISKFFDINLDWAFGITFAVFRIGHHAVLLYYSIQLKTEGIPIGMLTGTWIIHVLWFITWYRSLNKRDGKKIEEGLLKEGKKLEKGLKKLQ